jgi:putative nucleotidyltransferase with HDIG domain
LEAILQEALDRLLRLDWLAVSPKGAIFLVNTDVQKLDMVASSGLAEALLEECSEVAFGHCLCGRAAKFGNLVFASEIDHRHDTTYDGITEHGHYCLPILEDSTVLGVLNLYVNSGHAQDAREEAFLRSACDVLSGIIRHRRAEGKVVATADRLRENLDGTVKAMAVALEARDPYTAGHMERVTNLAVALGQKMNLSEETVETIRLAAGMHDIGKLQVPAEILSKPGRLNEHEFALIKRHSAVGYDILKDIDFAAPVATIVLQHHEKLDGSGYPQGLEGEDILLESRILAVADVVEAVASHRPYRPALGVDKALAILQEGAASPFDPAVVTACLELFHEGYEF